ncbi:hypothetical protein H0H92_009154 [Tricholoma furcatifolium]|nr:hypothetical protein H0H92_009154 [Tricholoma furcatifolium]
MSLFKGSFLMLAVAIPLSLSYHRSKLSDTSGPLVRIPNDKRRTSLKRTIAQHRRNISSIVSRTRAWKVERSKEESTHLSEIEASFLKHEDRRKQEYQRSHDERQLTFNASFGSQEYSFELAEEKRRKEFNQKMDAWKRYLQNRQLTLRKGGLRSSTVTKDFAQARDKVEQILDEMMRIYLDGQSARMQLLAGGPFAYKILPYSRKKVHREGTILHPDYNKPTDDHNDNHGATDNDEVPESNASHNEANENGSYEGHADGGEEDIEKTDDQSKPGKAECERISLRQVSDNNITTHNPTHGISPVKGAYHEDDLASLLDGASKRWSQLIDSFTTQEKEFQCLYDKMAADFQNTYDERRILENEEFNTQTKEHDHRSRALNERLEQRFQEMELDFQQKHSSMLVEDSIICAKENMRHQKFQDAANLLYTKTKNILIMLRERLDLPTDNLLDKMQLPQAYYLNRMARRNLIDYAEYIYLRPHLLADIFDEDEEEEMKQEQQERKERKEKKEQQQEQENWRYVESGVVESSDYPLPVVQSSGIFGNDEDEEEQDADETSAPPPRPIIPPSKLLDERPPSSLSHITDETNSAGTFWGPIVRLFSRLLPSHVPDWVYSLLFPSYRETKSQTMYEKINSEATEFVKNLDYERSNLIQNSNDAQDGRSTHATQQENLRKELFVTQQSTLQCNFIDAQTRRQAIYLQSEAERDERFASNQRTRERSFKKHVNSMRSNSMKLDMSRKKKMKDWPEAFEAMVEEQLAHFKVEEEHRYADVKLAVDPNGSLDAYQAVIQDIWGTN